MHYILALHRYITFLHTICDAVILEDFIGFNETTFKSNEWQTVLKYLQCYEKGDETYKVADEPFTDHLAALGLLLRYVLFLILSSVLLLTMYLGY